MKERYRPRSCVRPVVAASFAGSMLIGRLLPGSSRAWLARVFLTGAFAAGSVGCGSDTLKGSLPNGATDPEGAVTWNRDVAPIVTKKCVGCHQAGGIAPMTLADYGNAAHYAGKMLEQTQAGTMPPWGAQTTDECSPPFGFKDDPRLTADEQALLEAWVDQGMPEGVKPTRALPRPASNALEHPDQTLTIPSSVEIAGTDDRFVCFVLDPGNAKDRYLAATQINPGNPAIVHHVLIFGDPENQSADLADAHGQYDCFGGPGLGAPLQLLGAWAPGGVPSVMPPGVGLQLTGGSKIVIQVHYHPTRVKPETDASTSVDLVYIDSPMKAGMLSLVGNFGERDLELAGGKGYGLLPGPDDPASGPAFLIPPNATEHTETERFLIRSQQGVSQYRVFGVGTHMHYVGQDMKIEVEHEDGSKDCLLQTPKWDFNWQRVYYYDTPLEDAPVVRPGDVLTMRCTYNNSMANPFVRTALGQQSIDTPVDVHLGESTLDEMCLGAFGVVLE